MSPQEPTRDQGPDLGALEDAADYFENEADKWRGVRATPGSETADEAVAEAHRFDGYARAIRAALRAPSEVQPDETPEQKAAKLVLNGTHWAVSKFEWEKILGQRPPQEPQP